MDAADFQLAPIGHVRSVLKERSKAPRGSEGAPDARLEIEPAYAECLERLAAGQEIWILTWLHQARRSTHKVHPQGNLQNPLTGVFATRSPDRPNPIGLHRSRLLSIEGCTLEVQGLEVIDGTPVLDIKPVLGCPTNGGFR